MEYRLYYFIMTPAMVLTFVGGFSMLYLYGREWFKYNLWMHWKLLLVIGLVAYHFYSKSIIKKLGAGQRVMTSTQFRLYNEVTTLFLVAIVLLAVYKNGLQFIYALLGLVALGMLLGMGVRFFKKIRERADISVG